MKRRTRILLAIVVTLALVVAGIGVYLHFTSDSPPATEASDPWSYQIDAAGSIETTPEGVEITVPPDAVVGEATLTVTKVTQVAADQHAPFDGVRTGAVKFDISLIQDGVEIQPAEPLTIEIPLEGDLLPEGADPKSALLYTALPSSSTGYWLMQTQVKKSVLTSTLSHLSPKYISFVDPQKYHDEFWPDGDTPGSEDCKTSLDEVELVAEGWSNDEDDSPINACLTEDDDTIHVGIINRVNYMLSVTSDGMELETTQGTAEEELVMYFAGLLSSGSGVDGYVDQSGRLDASASVYDLPASLELQANADAFLAEAGWWALKVVVDVFTGGTGTEVLRLVIDGLGVVSCVQDALDTATGDIDVLQIVNLLTSMCTELIAKALGVDLGWGLFGKWVGWFKIAGHIIDGIQLVATAFAGFTMQFSGTMTVTLDFKAPECLSEWEANELFIRGLAEQGDTSVDLNNIGEEIEYRLDNYPLEVVCSGDWATARLIGGGDGIHLYEWSGSNWEILGWGSSWSIDHSDLCGSDRIPNEVKDRLGC